MNVAKKKPAQLSDSLLANRPRKGEAKPQTEQAAATASPETPKAATVPAKPVDRRKRRTGRAASTNTHQLNIRVSAEVLSRFHSFLDAEDLTMAEGLEALLSNSNA